MDTPPSDLMLEKARAARMAQAERGSATPLELVEQLGHVLEQLEQNLDRLHGRLEPVLVEAEPAVALTAEPAPGRTLLSQRLTHLTGWAQRLADAAHELHARVEL